MRPGFAGREGVSMTRGIYDTEAAVETLNAHKWKDPASVTKLDEYDTSE